MSTSSEPGAQSAAVPEQPAEGEQHAPLRPRETRMVTLPDVREGQVWEDLAPGHTEHGRRLRVLTTPVNEKGKPDLEGKVRVRNLQSWVESDIRLDRFSPEEGQFRRVV